MRPLHPRQPKLQVPHQVEQIGCIGRLQECMNTPTREIPPLDREPSLFVERRRRLSQGLTVDEQFDDAFILLGLAVGSQVVSIRGKVAQPQ